MYDHQFFLKKHVEIFDKANSETCSKNVTHTHTYTHASTSFDKLKYTKQKKTNIILLSGMIKQHEAMAVQVQFD